MPRLRDAVADPSIPLVSTARKEHAQSLHAAAVEKAATLELDRPARFLLSNGEVLELDPGTYRVQPTSERSLAVTSLDGRLTHLLQASTTWHELQVTSALALQIPGKKHDHHIVVLLPSGAALQASGSSNSARPTPVSIPVSSVELAEAVLKWQGPSILKKLPFDRSSLLQPWKMIWGTIEPGASPTAFGPSSIPPNWVSTTVASCFVPPAGSYGPGGPGTATGVPVFQPGSSVRRGAFAGYLTSVTPVTVSASVSMAGRLVQLLVTSHVVTVGIPTILSMTWTDVYQMAAAGSGAVTFPGVIVATGRVPTSPPAPNTTWPAEAAKLLTGTPGTGAPTVFELRIDGIGVATRTCRYNAQWPQSPMLMC